MHFEQRRHVGETTNMLGVVNFGKNDAGKLEINLYYGASHTGHDRTRLLAKAEILMERHKLYGSRTMAYDKLRADGAEDTI